MIVCVRTISGCNPRRGELKCPESLRIMPEHPQCQRARVPSRRQRFLTARTTSRSWALAPRPAASMPAGSWWARCPPAMGMALHPGPASRSDPRKHDGRSAGRPHVDDRAAGSRRNADRARSSLCHSAWNLSLGRQRRPAPLAAASASRRAPAVRLPAALAGGGIRRARHLRDPLGNRRRRQPRPEGREGERRARHRAGPGRGRLSTACRAARS